MTDNQKALIAFVLFVFASSVDSLLISGGM